MLLSLSTIFSILFAASFSRVLRSLALWLLERGGTIGLLDQLVGSLSVSSALKTQISTGLHRTFASHMLGVALIILWVMSPLGSQSVLRISSLVPVNQNTSASVLYLDSNNWSNLPPGGSDAMYYSNGADILFNAALASPIGFKEGVNDVWGHVKIPKLSHTSASEEDSNGWRPVNVKSLDDYSSLFGLPVERYGYSSGQTLDFTVESWYWDLACSRWSDSPPDSDLAEGLQFNITSLGDAYGSALVVYYNLTGVYGDSDYRVERPMCISDFPHQDNDESVECSELSARRFAVQVFRYQYASYCDISTEYVETHITCATGECSPRRMRQSRQPRPNRNWTIFDAQADGSAIVAGVATLTNQGSFWQNLARVLVGKPGSSGDPLAGYIVNPAEPFFADGNRDLRKNANGGVSVPSILTIEDSLITSRFAQVVNSYYMACIGNVLITASDDMWQETLEKDRNLTAEYDGAITNATSSSAITITTPREKFICSLPWLLIFTAVTLLSLISTVTGLVFTLQIKGPRLAMNVTTMLRDNLYSNLGQNASYMDDDHRSRKTRELKVRIGDVAPDRDVGHIAIATIADDNSSGVVGLRRGRLYN